MRCLVALASDLLTGGADFDCSRIGSSRRLIRGLAISSVVFSVVLTSDLLALVLLAHESS